MRQASERARARVKVRACERIPAVCATQGDSLVHNLHAMLRPMQREFYLLTHTLSVMITVLSTDHYCNFVDNKQYDKVSAVGSIITIVVAVIVVLVVVLRDVMKIWSCGGMTETSPAKTQEELSRQLTSMSAAYAGVTMPESHPIIWFENQTVQMGTLDTVGMGPVTLTRVQHPTQPIEGLMLSPCQMGNA